MIVVHEDLQTAVSEERVSATTPGISIIVPFHNIASVARRCVKSLLDQTLPAAELVLVDDGSTDGTAELLDSLADGNRIRTYHLPAAGPSAARNYGVARARCGYISFVDGDDVVSPCYVEALSVALSGMLAVGSRMPYGIADGVNIRKGRERSFSFPRFVGVGGLRTLSWEEVTSEICRGDLGCTSWARVAPRELYESIPFPEGKVYEDLHVLGQHLMASDCIVHVPQVIYGRIMRTGSITNRHGSLRDAADYLEAIESFERATGDLVLPDDGARSFFHCRQLSCVFSCLEGAGIVGAAVGDDLNRELGRIRAFFPEVESAAACREAVRAEIVERLPDIFSDPRVPQKDKLRFRLLALSSSAYERAFRGYGVLVKGVRR